MACPHGFAKVTQCVDCMYDDAPLPPAPRPEPEAPSRPFPARQEGDCPGCGFPIHVGQAIVRMPGGGYVHEGC